MPNNSERIEVVAGIQRRRRYSADEKLAVLAEAGSGADQQNPDPE